MIADKSDTSTVLDDICAALGVEPDALAREAARRLLDRAIDTAWSQGAVYGEQAEREAQQRRREWRSA